MQKIDLLEMSSRGDNDFESLSEVEKDLYVLYMFYSLRDMEGITHFYTHHAEHTPRLVTFLTEAKAPNARAITELSEFLREKSGGSWDVQTLDNYLCSISEEDDSKLGAWDQQYDAQTTEMWDHVREFTAQRYEITFD